MGTVGGLSSGQSIGQALATGASAAGNGAASGFVTGAITGCRNAVDMDRNPFTGVPNSSAQINSLPTSGPQLMDENDWRYSFTETVADHLSERPYLTSTLTIGRIVETGPGTPDASFEGG